MEGGLRIKDLPRSQRPRERLEAEGASRLSNAELIAILLRTGLQGFSAVRVAEILLGRFQRLETLARASVDEIRSVRGVGRDKAIALKAAFTLAGRMASELQHEAPLLDTPERVADLLREDNRLREVEQLQVLLVNTRHRLIRVERLSQGTQDTLLVHPRDVFRAAIVANAASVIVAHNHPSGDPTPSAQDIKVTRDLIRAGQLLKIDLMDHVILGRLSETRGKDYVSLRELGFFA